MKDLGLKPEAAANVKEGYIRVLAALCNQNYDKVLSLRSSTVRISQVFNSDSIPPEEMVVENSCFRSVLKNTAFELGGVIQTLEFIISTCFLNSVEAAKPSNELTLPPLDDKTLIDIAMIISNMAHRVSSMVSDITVMTFINRETTHYNREEKDGTIPSLEMILLEAEGDLERAIIGINAYLESLC